MISWDAEVLRSLHSPADLQPATCLRVPALPFLGCVTQGGSLSLAEPQASPCQMKIESLPVRRLRIKYSQVHKELPTVPMGSQ